jgi:DNA-binding NarL/FixJ family response regulator
MDTQTHQKNGRGKLLTISIEHADPIIAAGLLALLNDRSGLSPVSRRPTVSPKVPLGEDQIDVVLSDFHGGMAAVEGSSARRPRVLVMSQFKREAEIRTAIQAGVDGFLLSNCDLQEVEEAVRTVARGAKYLCKEVASLIAISHATENLTKREHEVLELIVEGACNKTISRQLGIALGTTKSHVKSILQKLGATTRTHAVAIASHRGLSSSLSLR